MSKNTAPKLPEPPSAFSQAFRLDGEVAVVTGGGSGLGLGIARSLHEAGATVVLVGRRHEPLASACATLGENSHPVAADITVPGAAEQIVKQATSAAGTAPTIIVNNAGVHLKKPVVETAPDEFEAVLRTHVFAAHALNRAALPAMIERRHGNILFTASMASLFGLPLVVAYSAAKSAYLGMVRSMAAELSPSGIRVNAIAPGWIETPMLRQALSGDPARSAKILGRTPLGAFGDPADIGWAAVYLCSPAARFLTGVVLPVDGGASIGF